MATGTVKKYDTERGFGFIAPDAGGVEIFAGVSRDPDFGLSLAFGMGGIAIEVMRDFALRMLPLREGDAEHLHFGDASFDTAVCALSLCTIPRPAAAIAEMRRVLVPGGSLLLLDHIGSTWPPVYGAQWLLERITIRAAGEHFTRRQLPLVQGAGFRVVETERLKAGTVERIHAVKPA